MDNLLFLFGKNNYLIQKEITKKITEYKKKESVDSLNIFHYDFEENSLEELKEELLTSSFFALKKIFILNNLFSLNLSEAEIYSLKTNFNNPDYLVIITNADERIKKAYEGLLDNFKKEEIKEFSPKEIYSYASKRFVKNNLSITDEALNLLLEKTQYNLAFLDQEIEKLILYKYDEQEINNKDINICLELDPENEIFNLVGYFINHNTERLLKKYNKLINQGNDPYMILVIFAKSISQMYIVKRAIEQGIAQESVVRIIGSAPGKVYYLARDSKLVSIPELEIILKKLSQIDYDVKTGLINIKLAFELFLLGGFNE